MTYPVMLRRQKRNLKDHKRRRRQEKGPPTLQSNFFSGPTTRQKPKTQLWPYSSLPQHKVLVLQLSCCHSTRRTFYPSSVPNFFQIFYTCSSGTSSKNIKYGLLSSRHTLRKTLLFATWSRIQKKVYFCLKGENLFLPFLLLQNTLEYLITVHMYG